MTSNGAMDFPHTFAGSAVGSRMNVVAVLQCWDPGHELHLFKSINDGMCFLVEGIVSGANEICTFMQATLIRHFPVPILNWMVFQRFSIMSLLHGNLC